MSKKIVPYTMRAEMSFIKKLGTHALKPGDDKEGPQIKKKKFKLLVKYLDSMKLRKKFPPGWNVDEVRSFAEQELIAIRRIA